MALAGSSGAELPTAVGGYELVVGGDGDGGGGKILGHRQFARYYRQKYRANDPRHSVAINRVLAQCVPPLSCGPLSGISKTIMRLGTFQHR